PGTSTFERAVVGAPAIAVIVADNQRFVAKGLAASGVAEVLEPSALLDTAELGRRITALVGDTERRHTMSDAAVRMTDGRGCFRLLTAVAGEAMVAGMPLRLRLAEPADEAWLLDLQRQPGTRQFALNPGLPTATEHARWFESTLRSEERLLVIAERG